jgi:hypothetical protein
MTNQKKNIENLKIYLITKKEATELFGMERKFLEIFIKLSEEMNCCQLSKKSGKFVLLFCKRPSFCGWK